MMDDRLSQDTKDFWIDSNIKYLNNPTPLEFLREGVCCYHPIIIRGVINEWPAFHTWNMQYLLDKIGENTPIAVNVTPNGYADSIQSINNDKSDCLIDVFTYPYEATMKMKTFVDMITEPEEDDAVPYLSQQNDNLRLNFPSLLNDIPKSINFADEAFSNVNIDAINLWIGDERSTSSLHKDHYENLYAVIEGEKTFYLLPPTDIAYLCEDEYDSMIYGYNSNSSNNLISNRIKRSELNLIPSVNANKIRWINENSTKTNLDLLSPIKFTVKAGEMLYIPSLWYHRVSQTTLTIAVNYWYEQKFDYR